MEPFLDWVFWDILVKCVPIIGHLFYEKISVCGTIILIFARGLSFFLINHAHLGSLFGSAAPENLKCDIVQAYMMTMPYLDCVNKCFKLGSVLTIRVHELYLLL